MSPDPDWAEAERIATIPERSQASALAAMTEDGERRTADWASQGVLAACGVKVVHSKSPRVFFRENRLFTEGIFDYLRESRGTELARGRAMKLAVALGRDRQ